MTDGVWRDEERLPLSELEKAMGAAAQDGQVDDVTGNDAGAEQAFGHGPEPADAAAEGTRPSTTGRTGPH